jgi:putative endonuclease
MAPVSSIGAHLKEYATSARRWKQRFWRLARLNWTRLRPKLRPTFERRQSLGWRGERIAESYLQQLGYVPIQRNWRAFGYEIDLVMRHGRNLIFIEVKWSTRDRHSPLERIGTEKRLKLLKASSLYRYSQQRRLQRLRILRFRHESVGICPILDIWGYGKYSIEHRRERLEHSDRRQWHSMARRDRTEASHLPPIRSRTGKT